MGTVSSRKVLCTDTSRLGSVTGRPWRQWHLVPPVNINYLELLMVFLGLGHFCPLLTGHHVLVRTDNMTVVAYINNQDGLRSRQLHSLAKRLLLWAPGQLGTFSL